MKRVERAKVEVGERVVAGVVARGWLQRAEERDQVRLLLGREADAEARAIEVDDLAQVRREAVVEVRKGRSKTRLLSTHCNPFKCFRATESR